VRRKARTNLRFLRQEWGLERPPADPKQAIGIIMEFSFDAVEIDNHTA